MDGAVATLSGSGVGAEEALAWLHQKAEGECFSLTDVWGVLTSVGIMKQVPGLTLPPSICPIGHVSCWSVIPPRAVFCLLRWTCDFSQKKPAEMPPTLTPSTVL